MSRWTGYVFGVYPLYDVYDNLPVLAYSSRNLNSFLRMDAYGPHLIYPKAEKWWSWTGSNRRPEACKATALPTELQPHRFRVAAEH
jgi:hypothetical protein